jgi:hypothetical protein
MKATCGGCSAVWYGGGICHCAACHRTFRSITGFDHHRRGGHCSVIGMHLNGEVWSVSDARPHPHAVGVESVAAKQGALG